MSVSEHPSDYRFQAEMRQLLHILVHSLYQDREIFLRELISNASDALTQMRFEQLTNQNVVDPERELAVHLRVEERDGEKWLIVEDSGIGMNRDEIIENLGTIAQSGARAFLERLDEGEVSAGDVIGQFGVGFYSVFMVADLVRVVSRSYRPADEAVSWVSRGDDSFHVEGADKERRGTRIEIKLRDDAEEFASEWRLKEIVKRHSDFVSYPIYLDGEQINQQRPLWRRAPAEVEQDEYNSFYQQMTRDFQEPLAVIHLHADAPVHVRALLFVPALRDRGVLAARTEPGVMLYSHNVLIQAYNTSLLPRWLSFVDGVVESEDLPLNVSRETVQSNRFIRQLGKVLRRRVVRRLEELAADEPEKYAQFWQQHSRTVKEGLATDPPDVETVMPLLRYDSSKEEGLTSLDDYIKRMPEGQEAIYYVLGDDVRSVARSPHLDPFRERDLEVLYWVDPLDPFLAPIVSQYRDYPLRNVDDADLALPGAEDGAEEEDTTSAAIADADFNRLVGRFVKVLGDRVHEVRASQVLRRSPARLVSPEGTANRELQRIHRYLDQEYEIPRKILELNRRHPLVVDLARLVSSEPDAAVIDLAVEQLFESALVQEGLHPNP
ncbi:MAG: molecular chaperone HtpG, partial [Anaerolineae bacterium]|nr:molecular chaperone HtpG [Anaerolineae bacterium]